MAQPNEEEVCRWLLSVGNYDAARKLCLTLLHKNPRDLTGLNGLGRVAIAQSDLETATQLFRYALTLNPGSKQALDQCVMHLMRMGMWKEAQHTYRAQIFKLEHDDKNSIREWDGSCLTGKTVLVVNLGFGDAIQFFRFVPALSERGSRVVFSCHHNLKHLIERAPGLERVVDSSEDPPRVDCLYRSHLTHLLLEWQPATVANARPFLLPKEESRLHWQNYFGRQNGSVVRAGLCWQGSSLWQDNPYRCRSLSPTHFRPLSLLPGFTFFSLQVQSVVNQESLQDNLPWIHQIGEKLLDFNEMAAAILSLDVVITVDTAVAHLAGALAKPCLLLLPYYPDWRWTMAGSKSLWSPSVRLYRQRTPGDWGPVVDDVLRDLKVFSLSTFLE